MWKGYRTDGVCERGIELVGCVWKGYRPGRVCEEGYRTGGRCGKGYPTGGGGGVEVVSNWRAVWKGCVQFYFKNHS